MVIDSHCTDHAAPQFLYKTRGQDEINPDVIAGSTPIFRTSAFDAQMSFYFLHNEILHMASFQVQPFLAPSAKHGIYRNM